MNSFLSIEEIKYLSPPYINHCKSPTKNKKNFFYSMENSIFREFKRDNDKFIGTDKYFISEEVENKKYEYLGFNFSKNYLYNGYCKLKGIYAPYKKYFCEKMTPCKDDDDLYISLDANKINALSLKTEIKAFGQQFSTHKISVSILHCSSISFCKFDK